jgi:gluconolactonase
MIPFPKECSVRSLRLFAVLLMCGSLADVPGVAQVVEKQALKTERLDPAFDSLVPKDAVIEKVVTGFTWVEGPVWIPSGYLLFADIPSNSIRKLTTNGQVSIFMQPSGYHAAEPFGGKEPGSNGMTLDSQGRLTVAGHAARNVWRLEQIDGHAQKTILADAYQGKKLNSPNDVVYKSDGSLYFTDPPYGLRTQEDNDPKKELSFDGVFRIPAATSRKPGSAPDNTQLQLLIKDLPRPNGIAFSPDEKYLYIANSGPKIWKRYPVKPDGTVGPGTTFYDATADQRKGGPDGMKVDANGNIFSAGPAGVWIISPEGKHLGTLLTPEVVANVAWGGPDHSTLYIMATTSVYRVKLKTHGLAPRARQR